MVRVYLQNGLEFPVNSLLIMAILFDIQDSKYLFSQVLKGEQRLYRSNDEICPLLPCDNVFKTNRPVKMMFDQIIGKDKINRPIFELFQQGFSAQINYPINPRKIISPIYINESLPVVISTTNI